MVAHVRQLAGQRFGRLTVRHQGGGREKRATWICACDCGQEAECIGTDLTRGRVKSCGCLPKVAKVHGNARRGQKPNEYLIWVGIRQRCANPKNKAFGRYGARGIKVCERWNDFAAFMADMGPRPSKAHSVERLDTNGPYSPSNCVWATAKQQANNTSRNIIVTYQGREMTLMQAVELAGAPNYMRALHRIRAGKSLEEALTQ